MSSATDVELPSVATCPECGKILGEQTRLKHDQTKRECPHCRRIYAAHEVFRHV